MEMAGIVTYTGALLIKQARELVEQVGVGRELPLVGGRAARCSVQGESEKKTNGSREPKPLLSPGAILFSPFNAKGTFGQVELYVGCVCVPPPLLYC